MTLHAAHRCALPAAINALIAACNIAGAQCGSHLAMRHGNVFVRRIFLILAAALIAKFGYDSLG